MIGKKISQYEITEQIGEGGMGVVYKARDTKLKRLVALKFLPTNQTASADQKKRFIREARAASNLDHSNVGTIYEIDETDDGELFIAMAYYSGDTLKERIAEGALSPEFAIRVGLQMAQGLSKAHQKGIFHRDIKPANILFSEDDEVKIVDFGLAKLADASYLTKTGETMGTVLYMSPEQVQGGKVDHRADIWALGVILYEMLTGKHPYGGDYEHAVMYSIVNEEPEPLDAVLQDVPEKLSEIIEKALAKEQENRYPDMEALIADLKVAEEQLGSTQAAGVSYRPRALKRKLKRLIRPLAPALVAMIAALIYFWPTPDVGADQVFIAVLPLKGIGEAQEEEWFQESMTDELITSLTKIGGLGVISRTSIMGYKTNPKPIPEIAKELNVDYVLEGSVIRLGDQIKISTALVDAKGNKNVWAENYQRSFRNVLKLQAEIARTIAEQVKVELAPGEVNRFARAREVDPEAYEAYLKGVYHSNKDTPEGLETSIKYFTRAIEIDSSYALAYAHLAQVYYAPGMDMPWPLNETVPKARTLAQKALSLDASLGQPHLLLAGIKRYYDRDLAGAEKELKLALELSPNVARIRKDYGGFLHDKGEHEQALKEYQIAHRLDPLDLLVSFQLAWAYFKLGQYDNAVEESQNVIELNPHYPPAYISLGDAYLALNENDRALRAYDKMDSLAGRYYYLKAIAGYGYGALGKKQKVQALLEYLLIESKSRYVAPKNFSIVYAALDDKDKAFAALEQAIEERDAHVGFFEQLPWWHSLRSDPRYDQMLQKNAALKK